MVDAIGWDAVRLIDLDILDYRAAWAEQERVHAEVLQGGEETVIFVEHPPTITLGRRAEISRQHITATPAELQRRGVEVVESDRGGDVTFHGPGQLVAYPILRLADRRYSVGAYMRQLQESVVDAIRPFGVVGSLDCEAPGVWADDPGHGEKAKICAVGVRVKRGVTLHGLALNVEPDLSYFNLIVPCNLPRPVTSLHRLLRAKSPSILAVKRTLWGSLKTRLACDGPA